MKRKFHKLINKFLGLDNSFVKGISKGIEEAEKKLERKVIIATTNALKAASVFVMVFVGLVLVLLGLSGYVQARYELDPGMGMMIVGAALIFLGWFAKLMRPN